MTTSADARESTCLPYLHANILLDSVLAVEAFDKRRRTGLAALQVPNTNKGNARAFNRGLKLSVPDDDTLEA